MRTQADGRRQSRHQPYADVGARHLEPGGDRCACRRAQAGNQLLALQAQQLADLTAVGRGPWARPEPAVRPAAAAQDQGREQLRRFLTPGAGYQPTTVHDVSLMSRASRRQSRPRGGNGVRRPRDCRDRNPFRARTIEDPAPSAASAADVACRSAAAELSALPAHLAKLALLTTSAARPGPRTAVDSFGGTAPPTLRPAERLLVVVPPTNESPTGALPIDSAVRRRSDPWAARALSISSWRPSPSTSIHGFGLLGGEVGFIATTLSASTSRWPRLFWSWGADEDILARLVKKTLFVGVFAFLIGNWNSLARIIFESFAGLGLKASGTGLSSADFLSPGRSLRSALMPDGRCSIRSRA